MSACISMHGEFSSHDRDGNFICRKCTDLDEDALIDARDRAEIERNRLREALRSIDALVQTATNDNRRMNLRSRPLDVFGNPELRPFIWPERVNL